MKVRALTLFPGGVPDAAAVKRAGQVLARAAARLEAMGQIVQTRRLALPDWEHGLGRLSHAESAESVRSLAAACQEEGIGFCGLGLARQPDDIYRLAELVAPDALLNGGADVVDPDGGVDLSRVRASYRVIQSLASGTVGGLGPFRFACGLRIRPGTPFFPLAYHNGPGGLAVAFENGDLAVTAFSGAPSLGEASRRLTREMTDAYAPVIDQVSAVATEAGIPFLGADPSIAPSLDEGASLAHAFAGIGVELGRRGTLAVCAAFTEALRAVPVPQCGYRGLMLPVLEDRGLAAAAAQGRLGLDMLLVCSSVCGVGVDTVPVPGGLPAERFEALLLDVGALSYRLDKPQSVRVLPVVGKAAGEWTDFDSPYLCNSTVFEV